MTTLTGRVVRPHDAEYGAASAGWNLLFDHHPAAVVFAQETGDVVNALTWSRANEVPVRVRSGRHSLEGWNAVDGGIVIDVSEMKSATIDADAETATLGAGLNQLEAVTALGAVGFAAPTGVEGSVGLVGATLGGGLGLLTRSFGMACDALLGAEMVVATANGGAEAIVVDEHHHPDLLWALRGAGNGNFGIVTSMTFRIRPLAQPIYVVATWRGLDRLPEVLQAWQRSAPCTDHRLTSQLEATRDDVALTALLVSGSETEARQLLSPILSVGTPEVVVTADDWAHTFAASQIPTEDEPANWKFTSQFMTKPLPPDTIRTIASFLAKAPTAQCNYFTNAFGGAVPNSEPQGGAAFAHRDALFYAEPGAAWGERDGRAAPDALTERCLGWVADFSEALRPYANGAYSNVPCADLPDWETAYWGGNVDRLRAVKATYDPDHVFAFEQGIDP